MDYICYCCKVCYENEDHGHTCQGTFRLDEDELIGLSGRQESDFFSEFKRFYDNNYIIKIHRCRHKGQGRFYYKYGSNVTRGGSYVIKIFFEKFKKRYDIKTCEHYSFEPVGDFIDNCQYVKTWGMYIISDNYHTRIMDICNYSCTSYPKKFNYEELINDLKIGSLIIVQYRFNGYASIIQKITNDLPWHCSLRSLGQSYDGDMMYIVDNAGMLTKSAISK